MHAVLAAPDALDEPCVMALAHLPPGLILSPKRSHAFTGVSSV